MNYYRSQQSWGNPQHQLAGPPQPTYVPQPGWDGRQYYRAHVGNGANGMYWGDGYDEDDFRDEGFFDSVWTRIKDVFSQGMGRDEARHWHHRVYGGLVQMDTLSPAQIGGAAGYEAVRHWNTYRSTYRSPLADDRDREREALAGIAVGEAQKLLSYSAHLMRHKSNRREAAEVAASTAERIYDEDFGGDPYDAYETSSRRRRNSFHEDAYNRRRRASSVGRSARPLIAATTGGSYVSAQPTGVSYVSSASHSSQPLMTGSSTYGAGTYGAGTYGRPYSSGVQYVTPTGQYYQAQPQYVSPTGGTTYVIPSSQPVTYTTGGQQYVVQPGTTAYIYPQQSSYQQSAYQQPAYQAAYQQPVAYTGAQPSVYTVPQGYSRARTLSTGGYAAQPGATYVYR